METASQKCCEKTQKLRRKRRVLRDKSRAKVAIEDVKEVRTLAELATEHKVNPSQIPDWKKR